MAGRRGNKPLEIRLDDERRAAWDAAAYSAGYSTSEYVRAAVEDRIEIDSGQRPIRSASKKRKAAEPTAERKTMCEHRLPPETYCPRCDPRPT